MPSGAAGRAAERVSDPEDDEPSLFEELLAETVGPFVADVAGEEIVVPVPSADAVCDLDAGGGPAQVLDLLVGEDTADDLLDLLEDRPVGDLVELIDGIRLHFAVLHRPSAGFTAVVQEIDLYGEAIEADLHAGFGLDLLDWFRDHERYPWSKLLRLLHRMPEAGHYQTACREDDDLAREVAELEERGGLPRRPSRPSLLGWSRDRELMTAMLDTLRRVEHASYAASLKFKGTGGRPPKDLPRPQSAAERVERGRAEQQHDELAAALLGDRYQRRTR